MSPSSAQRKHLLPSRSPAGGPPCPTSLRCASARSRA